MYRAPIRSIWDARVRSSRLTEDIVALAAVISTVLRGTWQR